MAVRIRRCRQLPANLPFFRGMLHLQLIVRNPVVAWTGLHGPVVTDGDGLFRILVKMILILQIQSHVPQLILLLGPSIAIPNKFNFDFQDEEVLWEDVQLPSLLRRRHNRALNWLKFGLYRNLYAMLDTARQHGKLCVNFFIECHIVRFLYKLLVDLINVIKCGNTIAVFALEVALL